MAAQDLLVNSGFETGTLAGWTVGGARGGSVFVSTAGTTIAGVNTETFGTARSLVNTGSFSASGIFRGIPVEPFVLSQTLSLVAGQTYTVGFAMANAGERQPFGASIGTALQIFLNGTGLLPVGDRSFIPGEWNTFETTFVATEETSTISFQVGGSGTSLAGASVDDFFVVGSSAVVPEPHSIALLATGLAAIGVGRLRRRRHMA